MARRVARSLRFICFCFRVLVLSQVAKNDFTDFFTNAFRRRAVGRLDSNPIERVDREIRAPSPCACRITDAIHRRYRGNSNPFRGRSIYPRLKQIAQRASIACGRIHDALRSDRRTNETRGA